MAGVGRRQAGARLGGQARGEGWQVLRHPAGCRGVGDVLCQHPLPLVQPGKPAVGQYRAGSVASGPRGTDCAHVAERAVNRMPRKGNGSVRRMRFTRVMRTPPHAPFLSLRLGLAEDGCFPDVPRASRARLRPLAGGHYAVGTCAGRSGRADRPRRSCDDVGLLCARALDLAPEQGREMRVELITLRSDIDALAHTLGCRRPTPDPVVFSLRQKAAHAVKFHLSAHRCWPRWRPCSR